MHVLKVWMKADIIFVLMLETERICVAIFRSLDPVLSVNSAHVMRRLCLFDIHHIFCFIDCDVNNNNVRTDNVYQHCGTAADSVVLTLSSRGRCVIRNDNVGRFKVFLSSNRL